MTRNHREEVGGMVHELQRGCEGEGVVFNPHSDHVVAFLQETLYDDYLCLVALNKQQIKWTIVQTNSQNRWITGNGNSQADADSSKHEVVCRNENCADHSIVSV